MTLPAGLTYRQLVGIWHRRKMVRDYQKLFWLELIAAVLPAVKN